jgi:regulator of telomere elongation helicase 1
MNHDCNKLCKDRRCSYRNRLEQTPNPFHEEGSTQQPVLDLEDLVSQGKEQNVCPFYYTRGLVEKAELILLPYNYLFDKDARQTTLAEIPWDNAVVIFDEAHNLESFASESASFDLSNVDIAGCVKEIQKVLNYVDATPDAFTHIKKDNLSKLKEILLQLDTHLINLGDQTAYAGEFMMDFFQRGASITHANHEIFVEEIRKVNDALMDLRGGSNRGSPRLEHFVQCLKRVFGYTMESRCFAKSTFYRVHVSPKQQQPNGADQARTISYWCFAPALAMQELASLKVRSILVTSGTLSPLPSYSMELGLHFPHQLENPHIIDDEQIYVRVVSKGPTGKLLSSAYERRKDGEYYTELGNTLVNFARIVPDGVLVFFPSYGVMETCLERWGGPAGHRKSYDNRNQFFAPRRQQSAAANKFSFPHVPSFSNTMSSHSTPWKGLVSSLQILTVTQPYA